MTTFERAIIVPGIYGSDSAHWQSIWEERNEAYVRFDPESWDVPDLEDWKDALSRAVLAAGEGTVLIAHSLANLLVAHWAVDSNAPTDRVAGAFLVSVPDPDGPAFPAPAVGFRRPPRAALPFPSLVVTSSNDPFGGREYQRKIASDWGSGWICVGDCGHLNSASGVGDWEEGARLLTAFTSALPNLKQAEVATSAST